MGPKNAFGERKLLHMHIYLLQKSGLNKHKSFWWTWRFEVIREGGHFLEVDDWKLVKKLALQVLGQHKNDLHLPPQKNLRPSAPFQGFNCDCGGDFFRAGCDFFPQIFFAWSAIFPSNVFRAGCDFAPKLFSRRGVIFSFQFFSHGVGFFFSNCFRAECDFFLFVFPTFDKNES